MHAGSLTHMNVKKKAVVNKFVLLLLKLVKIALLTADQKKKTVHSVTKSEFQAVLQVKISIIASTGESSLEQFYSLRRHENLKPSSTTPRYISAKNIQSFLVNLHYSVTQITLCSSYITNTARLL